MMRNLWGLCILSLLIISCNKKEIEVESIHDEVERIAMPYIVSGERVGIAIGTYDNGEKNFYSFGVKSLVEGGEIDENTMFEIGSITKVFTTTALAHLHLNGEVSLEDDLQSHFSQKAKIPSYNGIHIKLKHLANHTSSLPREPDNMNTKDEDTYFKDYTIQNFYTFINSYQVTKPIGNAGAYSNLGMGILGFVLKESQRKTYAELIQDQVLKPLNMMHTAVRFEDVDTDNIAYGYVGNQKKTEWFFSEVFEGAGVLKSNMSDMMRFLEAQLANRNDQLHHAIRLTHEKTAPSEIPGSNIGLGWVITTLNDGQQVWWHNGGTLSYNTFIGFNKETGKGVVVLMNSKNNHYNGEVNFGWELMKAMHKYPA